jgi:2-dehydropantoate 2-reductase
MVPIGLAVRRTSTTRWLMKRNARRSMADRLRRTTQEETMKADMQKPRIVFMGAGAMGSYIGGRIAQAGHDVTLVDGWREHVEAIRRAGICLRDTEGESSVRVPALHFDDIAELARSPVDIAFIAVKSYDTEAASRRVCPYLAPDGFLVSLQNGINDATLAGVVGSKRTLGCIASTIGVALNRPGHVERTYRPGGSYTVFRVGEVEGQITPRAELVARLLACVDSAEATADLPGERWAKLAANSMHNGLAAITGLGHKGLYTLDATRRVAIRLGAEAVRVARIAGLRLHPVRGIPAGDLEAAGYGDDEAMRRVEHRIEGWMSRLTDEARPSTAQDVAKARRTEIDYINGAVCAKAAELGIPVPMQRALLKTVKRVEAGEIAPRVENIAELQLAKRD